MTVASASNKVTLNGNDSTTVWPFAFRIFEDGDLEVYVTDSDGVETLLSTNYSVAINGESGGTVTYPSAGSPLASGSTITLVRKTTRTQNIDFTSQGAFLPQNHEDADDRAMMILQELEEEMARSVKLQVSDQSGTAPVLPDLTGLDGAVLFVRDNKIQATENATLDNLSNVSSISADITTVAGIAADVTTVAGISSDVTTVAANDANITTVAGSIGPVAGAIGDVTTVATNISDVTTVAASIADVNTYASTYLGPKTSNPTVRNDSSPLLAGDMYFNTTDDYMYVYTGSAWQRTSDQSAAVFIDTETGDSATTTFTLPATPPDENAAIIFLDGVRQAVSTYSVVGDQLTFSTAPSTGVEVEMLVLAVTGSGAPDGGVNITALNESTTGDPSNDYLLIFDASVPENRKISLANLLASTVLDGDFTADGVMVRTAAGVYATRSITSSDLTINNGDGVSGNITISIPDNAIGLAELNGGTANGLLGFDGSGDPAEVSITSPLSLSGNALSLLDDGVSLAKLAGGTANVLLGHDASGNPSEITAGTNITISGGVISASGGGGGGASYVFAVEDYGAVGDGATNDTTAIQDALDAADAAGGGIVQFDSGTYLTGNLTVYGNTTIRGAGRDATTLLLAAGRDPNTNFIESYQGSSSAITATPTAITKAKPGVVTATSHGLSDGDIVGASGIGGMVELNNRVFRIQGATANTFELVDYFTGTEVDTTNYTTFTSGGSIYKGTGNPEHLYNAVTGIVSRTLSDIAIEDLTIDGNKSVNPYPRWLQVPTTDNTGAAITDPEQDHVAFGGGIGSTNANYIADTDYIVNNGTGSSALTLVNTTMPLTDSQDQTDTSTFAAARRINITSNGGDNSGLTFTVVGTTNTGAESIAATEVIAGPTASATVSGDVWFSTITSVTPSGTIVGGSGVDVGITAYDVGSAASQGRRNTYLYSDNKSGNNFVSGALIALRRVDRATVQRCALINHEGRGIDDLGCKDGRYVDNYFHGITKNDGPIWCIYVARYGPFAGKTITGISKANPAVVTSTSHGLLEGSNVRLAEISGMTELNDKTFVVGAVTANTFELVDVDSSSYGTYTSGGVAKTWGAFSAPSENTIVANNTAYNIERGFAIFSPSGGGVLDGNMVDTYGEGGVFCGYTVNEDGGRIDIINNTFRHGVITDLVCNGIELSGKQNIHIRDNHIEDVDESAIVLTGVVNSSVTGNTFKNCATAKSGAYPYGPYSERYGFNIGASVLAGTALSRTTWGYLRVGTLNGEGCNHVSIRDNFFIEDANAAPYPYYITRTKNGANNASDNTWIEDNLFRDNGSVPLYDTSITAVFVDDNEMPVFRNNGDFADNVSLDDDSVTLAKLAHGSANRLIGFDASGAPSEIAAGTDITISAGVISSTASGGGRELLTADRTYYIRTDGNDSNDGLTNNSGGAFLTLQGAYDSVASSIDAAGYLVTFDFSDGTYTANPTLDAQIPNCPYAILRGNNVTPSNVVLNGTIKVTTGVRIRLTGLQIQSSSTALKTEGAGSQIEIHDAVEFGAATAEHMWISTQSRILISRGYEIVGGCTSHMRVDLGGLVESVSRTVTLTGSPSISTFAYALNGGHVSMYGMTYSGSPAASCTRYRVEAGSLINTFTSGPDATYFPGDTAGVVIDNGEYT